MIVLKLLFLGYIIIILSIYVTSALGVSVQWYKSSKSEQKGNFWRQDLTHILSPFVPVEIHLIWLNDE